MAFQVPTEAVKRYWDRQPCNLRHSPASLGSRRYFEEVEARKYLVEPHIPRFAEFARWKGKRVLEIGCGLGTDTVNFARAGALVTAVDLSERSLNLARQRARVYGLDVRFYNADAERLSDVVPVESYDLVYSFGVLHHTPHPERAVAEIRKYAGPGSTVKLMLYHRYSWKVLGVLIAKGRGAFWRLDRLVAEHSEAQQGCPVTYTYSRSQVRELLMGFEVQDMFVDHIFPYRLADYLQYRHRKTWYFRWMPRRAFRWLEQRFGWHLCVTARVPRQARHG